MISTNHAGSGKAGSGASAHVAAGSVHTGNFTNHFFCFFVYFQDALDGGCILQRVYVDDVGMGIGNMLLHLGAVFDGTGSFAQIRGNVVAQNFLGETQIVAVDPGLVYLRQERGCLSSHAGRNVVGAVAHFFCYMWTWLCYIDTSLSGNGQIKNQLFIPFCFMEPA